MAIAFYGARLFVLTSLDFSWLLCTFLSDEFSLACRRSEVKFDSVHKVDRCKDEGRAGCVTDYNCQIESGNGRGVVTNGQRCTGAIFEKKQTNQMDGRSKKQK